MLRDATGTWSGGRPMGGAGAGASACADGGRAGSAERRPRAAVAARIAGGSRRVRSERRRGVSIT